MKRSLILFLACSIYFLNTDLSAQNIGIGTNAPFDKVTIQTATASYGLTHTDGTIKLSTYVGGSTNGGWLGTQSNHSLNFFTNKSGALMSIHPNGNVGIGTLTPSSPLSFPNSLGNKISFWNAGANNDFGIGINSGVMQFYTAGTDKISFGWGNANAFTETLRFFTGSGIISFPNVFGTKISFWSNGPNADYGIGVNAGTLLIHTAGTDKIAFGWGNASAFNETMTFYTGSGQLGIGTTNLGTYRLSVNGNIRSKEVVVESGWADYVFEKNYKKPTLDQLEEFIKQHKHLPNIPSAREVEENGLHIGDIQKRMMEKVEELTLYVIELKKEIDELKSCRITK